LSKDETHDSARSQPVGFARGTFNADNPINFIRRGEHRGRPPRPDCHATTPPSTAHHPASATPSRRCPRT